MALLSAAELASLTTLAQNIAMPDTATIKTKTTSNDGYGTGSPTYSSGTTVPAGMSPPTAGQMQAYGSRLGSLVAWQVHMPLGTVVHEGDQITMNGQTLEVQVDLTLRMYAVETTVLASEVHE